MDSIIYILYYDDESEKKAYEQFGQYNWAKPIKLIDQNQYLENNIYFNYLEKRKDEWINKDYVGTLSYKAPEKNITPLFISKMIEKAEKLNKRPDVVTFLSYPNQNLINETMKYHPNFDFLWSEVFSHLNIMNYNDPKIVPFYCNYWMAKPQLMLEYIPFIKKVKYVLDNYQPIQEKLWENSYYPGNMKRESKLKVFGNDYYTYHPFICERTPCLYFNKFDILHCNNY